MLERHRRAAAWVRAGSDDDHNRMSVGRDLREVFTEVPAADANVLAPRMVDGPAFTCPLEEQLRAR